jgi:1-acyl-sn-glycerol-3-phosphate acyltransferase
LSKVPLRRPVPRGYRSAGVIIRTALWFVTKKDWRGAENLPETGAFIAVSNHVTYADPFTFAHYLYNNGYPPRFLAKEALFRHWFTGFFMRHLDQVPVFRGTAQAKEAVEGGLAFLARGDMIAMFPEGTLTREPNLWPMVARTGAARMALEAGVPVIPIAQWGAQNLLGRYKKTLHPIPRKRVTVVAGPPVNLDDLRTRPVTKQTAREATDRIMAVLTSMVEEMRGEKAPAVPYDMRTATPYDLRKANK